MGRCSAKQGALATARQEVNLLASHVERAQGVKSEQDRGVSATTEAIARLRAEALTLLRAKEAKDAELRSSQGRVLTLTSELKGKTGSAECCCCATRCDSMLQWAARRSCMPINNMSARTVGPADETWAAACGHGSWHIFFTTVVWSTKVDASAHLLRPGTERPVADNPTIAASM
jgi:hypothetical protein